MSIKAKQPQPLKTFTIRETSEAVVRRFIPMLLQYKHLENMLNLLLKQQYELDTTHMTVVQQEEKAEIFRLLLNAMVMKAVLSGTTGGKSTQQDIAKVNAYFHNNTLFHQAKTVSHALNDKNISMVLRRLKKDWDNYVDFLKKYHKNSTAFTGKPSYPKAKKLSKVFQYAVPLESSKFSLKKNGLLGINLGKKMVYTSLGSSPYFRNKRVNNVTVSLSHGFVYYHLTYVEKQRVKNKPLPSSTVNKDPIYAGGDVGVENVLSLFVHDASTKSLIISGKKAISYNCYFNKKLAEINTRIAHEVQTRIPVTRANGTVTHIMKYTNRGRSLMKARSALYERRKLFFDDYLQKISKKVVHYLAHAGVTDLALSKNLSFTKTSGSIQMQSATRQKFYQIPFGTLLNLIETKAALCGIKVTWINEAYTSKTSSISADVRAVQKKSAAQKLITPNDLNGNRGVKKAGDKKNPLGRGLFRDTVIEKVLNADLNAACNHIKVAFGSTIQDIGTLLWKWCNPIKIKSNHEFDAMLRNTCRIVSRRRVRKFNLAYV